MTGLHSHILCAQPQPESSQSHMFQGMVSECRREVGNEEVKKQVNMEKFGKITTKALHICTIGLLKPVYSKETMHCSSNHLARCTVGVSTTRMNISAAHMVLAMSMIAAMTKPISFVMYVSSPIVRQKKSIEA